LYIEVDLQNDVFVEFEQNEDEQRIQLPHIRESMVSLASKEAKDDVDRLFNKTEPLFLINQGSYFIMITMF
jgi:hypothetical protein